MTSMKENMILSAVAEYAQNHDTFRNRHISYMTGLAKQDIDYYFKKWEKRGFITRNPLEHREWLLVDLSGLIASQAPEHNEFDLRHSRAVNDLLDPESLERLHAFTDKYAMLKAIGMSQADLNTLRDALLKKIEAAIGELRTEIKYMHTKRFAPRNAKRRLENNTNGADVAPFINNLKYEALLKEISDAD